MKALAVPVGCVTLAAGLSFATLPAPASPPDDAWITTKVKVALLTDDQVDGFGIDVDTVDGRVTLHGQVDSMLVKAEAELLARDVKGVVATRNLLAVVPPVARPEIEVSDEALKGLVRRVLERDEALASSDIEVKSVHDGVVVLAGDAQTLSAHQRALEDVRAVPVVRQVASEIRSPDGLAQAEIWEGGAEPETGASLAAAASDRWITSRVKRRLLAEPSLAPPGIGVDTRGGIVTLFGSVETEGLRSRAEAQVVEAAGVKRVENDLRVVPAVVASPRIEAANDPTAPRDTARLDF